MAEERAACYRVWIRALARPILTWTYRGADQRMALPSRTSIVIVAALNEQHAANRAAVVGKDIMGGRDVEIGRIERKCEPGTHIREHYVPDAYDRPDVKVGWERVATPTGWDWLTKPPDARRY